MKTKPKAKLTILDLVSKILDSELPLSTKNEITRYYLLPKLGMTKAIIEDTKFEAGVVERPSKEEIDTENNPRLKAADKDFERLTGVVEEDDDQ